MPPEFYTAAQKVLIPVGVNAMIVLMVWLNVRHMQAKVQARVELNKHFLDKFATGQDLKEFLGREGSQRFLNEMWAEQRKSTKERILGTITGGVVVTFAGVAALLLGFFVSRSLMIPAAIALSVGIGLLVASAISYRLSNAWGLATEDGAGPARSVHP